MASIHHFEQLGCHVAFLQIVFGSAPVQDSPVLTRDPQLVENAVECGGQSRVASRWPWPIGRSLAVSVCLLIRESQQRPRSLVRNHPYSWFLAVWIVTKIAVHVLAMPQIQQGDDTTRLFALHLVDQPLITQAIPVEIPPSLQLLDVGAVEWVGSEAWVDGAELFRNRLGQPRKVVHETLRELDLAPGVHRAEPDVELDP